MVVLYGGFVCENAWIATHWSLFGEQRLAGLPLPQSPKRPGTLVTEDPSDDEGDGHVASVSADVTLGSVASAVHAAAAHLRQTRVCLRWLEGRTICLNRVS